MDQLLFARVNLLDVGDRLNVSGLFDRPNLVFWGRGLDGSTHAPVVSFADL